MKRKWIILLILLILAFAGYKYLYQDHRDIKTEEAEFVISSNEIAYEFSQKTAESEKKYSDKTIEITGIITEINVKDFTIDNSVLCQFNDIFESTLKIKDSITIKGRCIGYDDLLELVKIDQSTLIE